MQYAQYIHIRTKEQCSFYLHVSTIRATSPKCKTIKHSRVQVVARIVLGPLNPPRSQTLTSRQKKHQSRCFPKTCSILRCFCQYDCRIMQPWPVVQCKPINSLRNGSCPQLILRNSPGGQSRNWTRPVLLFMYIYIYHNYIYIYIPRSWVLFNLHSVIQPHTNSRL